MTDSKKILIVSDACYPELSPRAFRTTELARELGREGHRVTLLLPRREHFRLHPLEAHGVEVIYADGPEEHEEGSATAQRNRRLRRFMPKFLQRWILYFYCHELYARYNPGLYSRLCRIEETFDMVLSIAYPVAIHRAVTRAMRCNRQLQHAVCVAEFSDPPFRGDVASNVIPLYYLNLRRWAHRFDYFTIPVAKALPCYTPYIAADRIRIIPQGFDLQAIHRLPYTPHPEPTFAYAGRFYERIRDPQFFFDYLVELDHPFRMELYINHLEPRFAEMIARAQQLSRGTIVLHDALPREALIERLSTVDGDA